MSNLRDKLLDAGVVPKNAVREMEQWKSVPEGSSSKLGTFSPKKVEDIRKELDPRELPVVRETMLDADKIYAKGRTISILPRETKQQEAFLVREDSLFVIAGVDVLGRYLIAIPSDPVEFSAVAPLLLCQNQIVDFALPEPRCFRFITDISVLYESPNEGESRPTYWLCSTVSQGEDHIVRSQ